MKKENKKSFSLKGINSKIIIPLSVLISIILLSVIAVTANTVPYTVIDGDNKYDVSIIFPDEKALIEKAKNEGMKEFTELDDAVLDETNSTLTIYRAVDLTLNIEGEKSTIHANVGQTVESALKEANINSDGAYNLLPSGDTVITSDTQVRLNHGYIVYVNGTEYEISSENDTVAAALKEANINYDDNDGFSPDLSEKLYPGMEISYVKGYKIKVSNGSFTAETSTFATTVEEFLKEREITLDSDDRLSPSKIAKITDGTEIIITRVYSRNETFKESTPYETEYETSIDLYRGGTKVKTPGEEGIDEVSYTCIYENGELVSKTEISRKTLKEPVTEVILEGSKGNYQEEVEAAVLGNTGSGDNFFIDHNGNKVYYKRQLYGEATAYYIPGGITSVGLPVARGVVAVDPKVIPYGSKLYITSGSYCYGYAIAGDTGGAMLSGRVLTDLYMESLDECYEFGRRNMTVYIIE
ncbi:MAG: DUF348 domain-containing protein [Ruminococcaceae bacterium]|nr:DUF348 domain-containing protein [Oscillospiraceae bacterium]